MNLKTAQKKVFNLKKKKIAERKKLTRLQGQKTQDKPKEQRQAVSHIRHWSPMNKEKEN